ncbi:MAG: RcnB family protein [Sphingomonadaceae bacterium]
MRTRMLLAALLAGSMITPVAAQMGNGERGPRAERMERGDVARNPYGGGETRREWRERQVAPQVQQQVPVAQSAPDRAPRPDGSMRRGGDGNGWRQRREAPVAQAAPQGGVFAPAPQSDYRRFRRREAPVVNAAPVLGSAPPATRPFRDRDGDGIRNARDFDRNNDGRVDRRWDGNRNGVVDRRFDRDRDGIRDGRDRDRDNDGIRNRRDWDRNNDGRVDPRWDRNRNGIVDRRFDYNRDGARDWNSNRGRYDQRWNRDWRNDRRYDWQRHRYANRSFFRQPRYYSPYGYGHSYQRFGVGVYLDSAFFGSRYHLDNPYDYRLPQASWPYRWVRYYDDVLLVDTRNGYVVDVIHNFFW